MGRHRHIRRVPNHFVLDAPFPVGRLTRQVERDGEYVYVCEFGCQPTGEIFEVGPVVPVEPFAYLWGDVGEQERSA